MQEHQVLDDIKFNAELDGFLSPDTEATVASGILQVAEPSEVPSGTMDANRASGGDTAGAAAAVAGAATAAVSAAAGALMAGKLGDSGKMVGETVGKVMDAAVPTSLAPVKERAGVFLSKAQPWKSFLCPLSKPTGADAFSRMTGNLHVFQTNYAILFILNLVLSIFAQPSAMISIGVTIAAWVLFLKKNDDPDWEPEVGGMKLSSSQRFLGLAGATALGLLFFVGGVIVHAALMFALFLLAHGLLHDPSGYASPGGYPHQIGIEAVDLEVADPDSL